MRARSSETEMSAGFAVGVGRSEYQVFFAFGTDMMGSRVLKGEVGTKSSECSRERQVVMMWPEKGCDGTGERQPGEPMSNK
jgi:hypothetical protein